MSSNEDKGQPKYHSTIFSLLEDIASLNPNEGPVELICLWFDDFYLPDHEDPERWRSCFTEHELNTLAEFHSVFDREEKRGLNNEFPGWAADPGWLKVRDAARVALARMRPADKEEC